MSILAHLSLEDFKTETEISLTKWRWAVKNKEDNQKLEDEEDISEEEKELFEDIENETRQIYNPTNKCFDFRKMRVTDLKQNTKIHLPKPLPTRQEACAAVRRERWEKEFKEYFQENCKDDGSQKSNLTPAQQRGIAKLKKRIKEGSLMVVLTDKSGKLAVTTPSNYLKMGEEHTKNDAEVDEETASDTQRKLNGHMSMWLKITQAGDNWNHKDRFRETCINQSNSVSPMYMLLKDHKPTKPGEIPKTRPVVSGCNGMGVHLSNHLSEIVDAVADCIEDKIEVISTEDFLSRAAKYNREVSKDDQHEVKKVAVTGADAVGLYPNLIGRHSARLVKEAFLKGNLKLDGIDYKEAARYVVMGYDQFEIRNMGLERNVPKRIYNMGPKPGVTGKDPLGKEKEGEEEVQWAFPSREPTSLEKRKLFGACLEIGVRKSFALHLYQFGGKIYRQTDGGPIGMRLAGSVARVVMAEWGSRMMSIMKENNIEVWLAACYVDDVRFITSIIEKGVRWEARTRKFARRDDWIEEDLLENASDEKRTATELQKAMNSIFANLQFTTEIPEDFRDGKLPTLDCRIWPEERPQEKVGDEEQDRDAARRPKLIYSFFEKEMNSPFCILESSALPSNTKVSSLSQDVIRRMLNTCELVHQEERNEIVEKFISKLRRSGYQQEQIVDIVSSGLKGYERKLARARKEGKCIHREARSTIKERFRKKITGKKNWFKNKKDENEAGLGKNKMVKEMGKNKANMKDKAGKKDKAKDDSPLTVLFVPKTKGGELARRLRLAENEIAKITGDRIKIVERAGVMIKRILHKSNPWAGSNCMRDDCLVCRHERGGGDCKKRNITYKTECLLCLKTSGKASQYFVESSRTVFESEHDRHYLARKEDSHMMKHWQEDHASEKEKANFSMKIVRSHTSALARQVHEAVLIEMNSESVLNSKGEYNRCQLPKLGVQMGDRTVQEDGPAAEMNEMEIFSSVANSKKRKDERQKDEKPGNQPSSKRRKVRERKFKISKPELTTPGKRKFYVPELSPSSTQACSLSQKKARTDCTKKCPPQTNPRSEKIRPEKARRPSEKEDHFLKTTKISLCQNIEDSLNQKHAMVKPPTFNLLEENKSPGKLDKNLSKTFTNSNKTVKGIINFFENAAVTKPGGPTTTEQAKTKKSKANSKPTATPKRPAKIKLKSTSKKSNT